MYISDNFDIAEKIMRETNMAELYEAVGKFIDELTDGLGLKVLEALIQERKKTRGSGLDRVNEGIDNDMRRNSQTGIPFLVDRMMERLTLSRASLFAMMFSEPTRFRIAFVREMASFARETASEHDLLIERNKRSDQDAALAHGQKKAEEYLADKYQNEIAFLGALDAGRYDDARRILSAVEALRDVTGNEDIRSQGELCNWKMEIAVAQGDIAYFLEAFYGAPEEGNVLVERLAEQLSLLLYRATGAQVMIQPSPFLLAQTQNPQGAAQEIARSFTQMAMNEVARRLIASQSMEESEFRVMVQRVYDETISKFQFDPRVNQIFVRCTR